MGREQWSDERRQDYEDTMRDKAREAEEAERFDDEPREAACCSECTPETPCGECIICEEEEARVRAKAAAWDALVEMRGEIGWNDYMAKWWAQGPIGRDDVGLVEHTYANGNDPIAAVMEAHRAWVKAGRFAITPPDEATQASIREHMEARKLEEAEEIKARRAKGDRT